MTYPVPKKQCFFNGVYYFIGQPDNGGEVLMDYVKAYPQPSENTNTFWANNKGTWALIPENKKTELWTEIKKQRSKWYTALLDNKEKLHKLQNSLPADDIPMANYDSLLLKPEPTVSTEAEDVFSFTKKSSIIGVGIGLTLGIPATLLLTIFTVVTPGAALFIGLAIVALCTRVGLLNDFHNAGQEQAASSFSI